MMYAALNKSYSLWGGNVSQTVGVDTNGWQHYVYQVDEFVLNICYLYQSNWDRDKS